MKKLTLALGGGGAKGNAHIGVLKVLEQEGFHIQAVAGSSFGGVVGALYAAGYSPDEILTHFSQVQQSKLYNRNPDDPPALMGLKGAESFLGELLGERKFEELRIPFAVTAVDLQTGKELEMREGSVLEAVMTTIAVPGIFPPQPRDDQLLADGAVLNPVPVALARSLAPGLPVVAVVLSRPGIRWEDSPHFDPHLPIPVYRRIAKLRFAQAFSIFLRSVEISSRSLAELRLRIEKPDVVLRPEVDHIGLLDKVNVDEVARLGEKAAREKLPEIHAALSWRARLLRRINQR